MGITIKNINGNVGAKTAPTLSFNEEPKINGIKIKNPEDIDYRESSNDKALRDVLSFTGGETWSMNEQDYNHAVKDGVIPSPAYAEEELNKEKAKKQSAVTQLGRSLAQILENEVGLGTVIGFSDMFDAVANGLQDLYALTQGEEHLNDFNNDFSRLLNDAKEKNKQRLAIYREDPNKAFAIADTGWWFDNFVTVGTTASLLIPSLALTKAPSLISKSIRMAKVGKLNEAINVAKEAKNTEQVIANIKKANNILNNKLENAIQVGASATISRTMENYMEAREVYDEIYKNSLTRLKNLTPEQRKEFFENNPSYVNLNDKEIAQHIADAAGMHTFWEDYWMLLMDIPQFKALSPLWKGVPNKVITPRLSIINKNAAKTLGQEAGALTAHTSLTELGKMTVKGTKEGMTKNTVWNRLKERVKNPFSTITTLELGEGVEEGFQGIQQEKGREIANLIFDPNISTKSLDSYLSDPHIWEQAFWGVIGGISFKAIGTGFGNIYRKIDSAIEEKKITDDFAKGDYAKYKLTDAKQRELEILTRTERFNRFIEKMNLINEGKNPYEEQITDPTTNEKVYQTIEERDKEIYREKALSEFLVDFTLDAADAGNFEYLLNYINSPEFNNELTRTGTNDVFTRHFENTIQSEMKDIYNTYLGYIKELKRFGHNPNPYVNNIIARYATRNQLTIDSYKRKIQELDNQFDKIGNIENYDKAYNTVKAKYYKDYIANLEKQQMIYGLALVHGEISVDAHKQYTKDLEKEKELLERFTNIYTSEVDLSAIPEKNRDKFSGYIQAYERFVQENLDKLFQEDEIKTKVTEEQKRLLEEIVSYEFQIEKSLDAMPSDYEHYIDVYDQFARHIDLTAHKRFEDALKRVKDYITNAENPTKAYNDFMFSDKEIYQDVAKDRELLKLGYRSTGDLLTTVRTFAGQEIANRKEKKEEAKKPKSGGEVTINSAEEQEIQNLNQEEETQREDEENNNGGIKIPVHRNAPPVEEGFDNNDEIPNDYVDNETYEDEIPPIDETPTNDVIELETRIASFMVDNFVNNNYPRIKQLIVDILRTGEYNSTSYNELFNIVKEEVTAYPEYADVSINQITGGIIAGINACNNDLINSGIDFSDNIAKFTLDLITNNQDLKSVIPLLTISKSDEKSKINFITKIIKDLLHTEGFDRVYKNQTYQVDIIKLFNNYVNEGKDKSYIDLYYLYELIKPYLKDGIANFKFINTNTLNAGFKEFINNRIKKVVHEETFNDHIRMASVNWDTDLNTGAEAKQILHDIAAGIIKNPNIKLVLPGNKEEGTYDALTKTTLKIIYTDKDGKIINLGYINRVNNTGKQGNGLKKINAKGFNFIFTKSGNDIYSRLFDKLFKELDDANNGKNGNYLQLLTLIKLFDSSPIYSGLKSGIALYDKQKGLPDLQLTLAQANYILGLKEIHDLVLSGNDSDISALGRVKLPQYIEVDELGNKKIKVNQDIKQVETTQEYKQEGIRFPYVVKTRPYTLTNGDVVDRYYTEICIPIRKEDGTLIQFDGDTQEDKNINRILAAQIILKNLQQIIGINIGHQEGVASIADRYRAYKQMYYQQLEKIKSIDEFLSSTDPNVQNLDGLQVKINHRGGVSLHIDPNNEYVGINQVLRERDAKLPCVYIHDMAYGAIDEQGNRYEVPTYSFSDTIGFVLDENTSTPLIIFGKDNTLIGSGSEIAKDLKTELTNLFDTYLQNPNEDAYEDLKQALILLLDGEGRTKKGAKIFEGIKILEINNKLFIKKVGSQDPIAVISKYSNKTTNGVNQDVGYLRYIVDKAKQKMYRTSKPSKQIVNNLANNIITSLKFKQSSFVFNNVDNQTTSGNRYFYKENGNFVIEIAGNKREYSSYGQFIIKENTMLTNVRRSDDGRLMITDSSPETFEIEVSDEVIGKVETNKVNSFDNVRETLENAKEPTKISTKDLLKSFGIEQNIIDILIAPIKKGMTQLSLVPDEIYLDNKETDFGSFKPNSKEIHIGRKVFDIKDINSRNKNLIRTVIHEGFHKNLSDRKLSNEDREQIINDLLDTYNVFIQSLEANRETNDEAQRLYDAIIDNKFNLKDFIDKRVNNPLNIGKNKDELVKKYTAQFAEEWLVESLTNISFANYLNHVQYKAELNQLDGRPKSIFQKIVDAIVKLFNKILSASGESFGKIENNTILARHYLLLSNNYVSTNATPEVQETKEIKPETKEEVKQEDNTKSPVEEVLNEQEPIIDENDIELSEEEKQRLLNRVLGDEDDLLSTIGIIEDVENNFVETMHIDIEGLSTTEINDIYDNIDDNINMNGTMKVENMNDDFLNRFDLKEMPLVASLVQNGEVEYYCK